MRMDEPTYLPHSQATAAELRDMMRDRGEALIDPFLTAAISSQFQARDGGGEEAILEKAAEAGMVSVDWERAAHTTAVAEAVCTLLHFCQAKGLSWPQVSGVAMAAWQAQDAAICRYLVWGRADDPNPYSEPEQ